MTLIMHLKERQRQRRVERGDRNQNTKWFLAYSNTVFIVFRVSIVVVAERVKK